MFIRELNNLWSTNKIRRGIIRTITANEELDSAKVVLTQVDTLDIEAYDLVVLTNEFNNNEIWCVAGYSQQIVKRGQSKLYDYEVDLMSPTKLLEGSAVPNMAITNVGQDRTRTLLTYIKNAFYRYFKSDYLGVISYGMTQKNILNVDIDPAMFNNNYSNCEFSQPTLREYLDYILNFYAMISRLEVVNDGSKYIFTLKAISLNPTDDNSFNDAIEKVNNFSISQSAGDYVKTIVSEMNDIVATDYITEKHYLRTDDYAIDSNNASIMLDYKPYDIRHLYCRSFGTARNIVIPNLSVYTVNGDYYTYRKQGYIYIYNDGIGKSTTMYIGGTSSGDDYVIFRGPDVDLMANCITTAVYESLDTLDPLEFSTSNFQTSAAKTHLWCKTGLFKNNTISWNRGSKAISNLFHQETKKGLLLYTNDTLSILAAYINAFVKERAYTEGGINKLTYKYRRRLDAADTSYTTFDTNYDFLLHTESKNGTTYAFVVEGDYYPVNPRLTDEIIQWQNMEFEVEYKPYTKTKIVQTQEGPASPRHNICMLNSVTNARTDFNKYYKSLVEKNKQLGNPTISFSAVSQIDPSKSDNIVFKCGMRYTVGSSSYVLNKIEYTVKNNVIQYQGTLTKNYSNRNINNVLNREKRYTAYPDVNESIVRSECEVVNADDISPNFLNENYSVFCRVITDGIKRGTLNCTRSQTDEGYGVITAEPYNNVSLNFRKSNVSVSSEEGIEKLKTEYLKYVDETGECKTAEFIFYFVPKGVSYGSNLDYNSGVVNPNYAYRVHINEYFIKDSREILVINLIVKG